MRLNRLVLPLYLLPLAFNESCSAKPTVHILNQDLVFHVIDTGQGSSALVELPDNKLFLIDSGYDTTKTRQFFNGLSNRQIDYFLTTHGDQDHINNGK
jgi:beta-lactamase superfamily II metal-dependent hydrolase